MERRSTGSWPVRLAWSRGDKVNPDSLTMVRLDFGLAQVMSDDNGRRATAKHGDASKAAWRARREQKKARQPRERTAERAWAEEGTVLEQSAAVMGGLSEGSARNGVRQQVASQSPTVERRGTDRFKDRAQLSAAGPGLPEFIDRSCGLDSVPQIASLLHRDNGLPADFRSPHTSLQSSQLLAL